MWVSCFAKRFVLLNYRDWIFHDDINHQGLMKCRVIWAYVHFSKVMKIKYSEFSSSMVVRGSDHGVIHLCEHTCFWPPLLPYSAAFE